MPLHHTPPKKVKWTWTSHWFSRNFTVEDPSEAVFYMVCCGPIDRLLELPSRTPERPYLCCSERKGWRFDWFIVFLFFLKLDHSPTTSSQYEGLLQQKWCNPSKSRDGGRGCLHGWSMWSIKPAQVTIVKPYFTLVPCKEEIVSRTRFDVKLWPTLKRWNLWGSWDVFQCFCHGFFCHFSRECLYSDIMHHGMHHGVSKWLLMRITQGVMVSKC